MTGGKSEYMYIFFSIFEHMSPVPLKITRKVSKLFAGFGYYAVVTDGDEVCIWENTLIGRANHGGYFVCS